MEAPTEGKRQQRKPPPLSTAGYRIPPTDSKADSNHYRQQNGLEAATAAFNGSLYHPTVRRQKLSNLGDTGRYDFDKGCRPVKTPH